MTTVEEHRKRWDELQAKWERQKAAVVALDDQLLAWALRAYIDKPGKRSVHRTAVYDEAVKRLRERKLLFDPFKGHKFVTMREVFEGHSRHVRAHQRKAIMLRCVALLDPSDADMLERDFWRKQSNALDDVSTNIYGVAFALDVWEQVDAEEAEDITWRVVQIEQALEVLRERIGTHFKTTDLLKLLAKVEAVTEERGATPDEAEAARRKAALLRQQAVRNL
jgi:hypothetical protein